MHLSFDVAPCQRVTTLTLYHHILADLPLAPLQCTILAQEYKDGNPVGQMSTLQECCKACSEMAPIACILEQDQVFDEHGIAHATVQLYLTPEHNRRPETMQFFLRLHQETPEYGRMQSNAALVPLRREQQCFIEDVRLQQCDATSLEDLPQQEVLTIIPTMPPSILCKRCVSVRWGEEVYPARYVRQENLPSPVIQITIPCLMQSIAAQNRLYSVVKRRVELLNSEGQAIGRHSGGT